MIITNWIVLFLKFWEPRTKLVINNDYQEEIKLGIKPANIAIDILKLTSNSKRILNVKKYG